MKITESDIITSKDNARLKSARAVRDGRENKIMFVEGFRLVGELLSSELRVTAIYVSETVSDSCGDLVERLSNRWVPDLHNVADRVFDSIIDTDNSQGIVVLADRPEAASPADLPLENALIVYLNRVNNPSNLGAVVRTAEAAGATAIVMSPGSTDPYSPKALRASMGSAFRLPVVTDISLDEFSKFANERAVRTVAMDVSGGKSYVDLDWTRPTAVVFGSEAHGLGDEELSLMDEIVRVPMANDVESLNLAVSAGIVLFEAKRRRH